MLTFRQRLFITYYTEGETKGNATKAGLMAGYKKTYAEHHMDRMVRIGEIKEAIDNRLVAINNHHKNTIESVNADFEYAKEVCKAKKDMTNYIRIAENQAKNAGYYGLDHLQETEQVKLTEDQVKEAAEYAKWRLLRRLAEPQKAQEGGQQATG